MLGGLEFILFSALCVFNGIGMCGDCFPIPLQQASNCNGTVHMRYAWNNESDTCTATQVIDCDSSFADTFASLEECMSYASSRAHSCNLSLSNLVCDVPLQPPVNHYHFESASQECVCFPYFGPNCQGNNNNFLTLEDCLSICNSTTTELIATTTSILESLANSTLETVSTATNSIATEPFTDSMATEPFTDSMATEPFTVKTLDIETRATDSMATEPSVDVYAYICIGIGVIALLLVASSITLILVVTWKILRVRLQQNKIMQKEDVAVMTHFSVGITNQHSQCGNTLPPTAIL